MRIWDLSHSDGRPVEAKAEVRGGDGDALRESVVLRYSVGERWLMLVAGVGPGGLLVRQSVYAVVLLVLVRKTAVVVAAVTRNAV